MVMLTLALPLLLAATVQSPSLPSRQVVAVSVEIVAAEEIRFTEFAVPGRVQRQSQKQAQMRVRGEMPMIEFY